MSNNSNGKLIFSNPAHPDSAFTPEMKKVGDVAAFASHPDAENHKSAKVFTMPDVAVYTVPSVMVSEVNPLIIGGTGPVSVQLGTVTLQPGGQIFVMSAADITIDNLIKQE